MNRSLDPNPSPPDPLQVDHPRPDSEWLELGLRRAVEPPPEAVRRVVAAALTRSARERVRLVRPALAAALVLALIAGARMFPQRPAGRSTPEIGKGSDGRALMVVGHGSTLLTTASPRSLGAAAPADPALDPEHRPAQTTPSILVLRRRSS